MTEAGYSGTPLITKLGIKPEMKILLINQPIIYFYWLGLDITNQYVSKNELPDLIHLFALNADDFKKQMKPVLKFVKRIPQLLFGYPGIKTVLK
jgi:hypothetical protein